MCQQGPGLAGALQPFPILWPSQRKEGVGGAGGARVPHTHPADPVALGNLQMSSSIYGTLDATSVSFPGGSEGKESACDAGDPGLISVLGRSPGGGHGNPLQCSCLGIPMDEEGAWGGFSPWGCRVGTRLSDFTFTSMGCSEGPQAAPGKSKEAEQEPCAHWPLSLTHYWPHAPQE